MNARKLRTLFFSQLSISCLCFGGGLTITAMLRRRFVEELHWLEPQEMLDLTAIAQVSPGPTSCNTAVMVGYRVCGLPGALVCALAAAIPPVVLLTVMSMLYEQLREISLISRMLSFMQLGITAYLWDILLGMLGPFFRKEHLFPTLLLVSCLAGRLIWKLSVTTLFLGCLCLGLLELLVPRDGKKEGC